MSSSRTRAAATVSPRPVIVAGGACMPRALFDMATLQLLLLAATATLISSSNAAPSDHPLKYENFQLKDNTGKVVLQLDAGRPELRTASTSCKSANDIECRSWGAARTVRVAQADDRCVVVTWTAQESESLLDCFSLGDANWYGGPENIPQMWPLEKFTNYSQSMVTQETANRGITDPFWFNSRGLSVYVAPGVPLFMSINAVGARSGGLCLEAKIAKPYRARPAGFHLKYTVCQSENAKAAFKHAVDTFLGKPTGYPDERMIRYPVWSTWAKYKAEISDEIVRDFGKQIKDNGFKNSQLEIDDRWETCYGSKIVDTSRFPDMKQLTDYLRGEGFRVTIWTHPFIQLDCTETLQEASQNGYLALDENGSYRTHWWNGWGSIIDFTKESAQNWFIEKHQKAMQEYGFDGYKFDAGETSWFPQLPNLSIPADIDEQYPSLVTKQYVQTCAKFGNVSEVRSAYLTQKEPIFLRMIDKDSRWGYDNGLKSLVTTLLQMNMVGYSLVLPDMIGGNQYNLERADKELFIRWLQANTFMPSLQFALVPWDYDEETVTISKTFADLHDQYTDNIIAALKKNVADGSPVNPPIWWISPDDSDALKEDTEYLLGEDILVAPILDKGATSRDIYLPQGKWKDGNTGDIVQGPTTIKNYPAPLTVLPYFIKTNSASSLFAGLLAITLAPLVVLIS